VLNLVCFILIYGVSISTRVMGTIWMVVNRH